MSVSVSVAQSCPTLCDPMNYVAHQAPPSIGFSRQEYWSGVPLPSPQCRTGQKLLTSHGWLLCSYTKGGEKKR